MLNMIPVFGWLMSAVFAFSIAVPFWFIWTFCEIGETYFYWLPLVYHRPGLGACIGLVIVVSILKSVLTPRIVSVSNNSKSKSE